MRRRNKCIYCNRGINMDLDKLKTRGRLTTFCHLNVPKVVNCPSFSHSLVHATVSDFLYLFEELENMLCRE